MPNIPDTTTLLLGFAVLGLITCIVLPIVGHFSSRRKKKDPLPPILTNRVDEWV